MKNVTTTISLCAIVITFGGMIEPAQGTLYTFSQGGWSGGGEITGRFEIDENHSSISPGFLFREALISMDVHWSGNVYTQPFDWGLSDVGGSFLFRKDSPAIVVMVMGTISLTSVYYDATLPLLWDARPSHIDISPNGDSGRYRSPEALILRVPEGSSTFLLMGITLTCLIIARNSAKKRAGIAPGVGAALGQHVYPIGIMSCRN